MSDAPKPGTAEHELAREGHHFEFFQAVRLLERLRDTPGAVGGFGNPADEPLRFGANPDLAFPPGEIEEIQPAPDQWRMRVNFMGLVGHMGVLPTHYTTLVLDELRSRRRALMDFLDLLHHRFVGLFYRAWQRYRFYVPYERRRPDPVTEHLYDVLGLGTVGLRERLDVEDPVLLGYVGLLGPGPRSAAALEQLIEDHFGVPAEIEQFVGGWYPLTDDALCLVDHEATGIGSTLGVGSVVGDEVYDVQARARIVLGPLERRTFDAFLPGGRAHRSLRAMARFFSDDELDLELKLVLRGPEVPAVVLGEPGDAPLGRCSWLRTRPMDRDPDETVLTL